GGTRITDGISQIAGVESITTGSAIGKPVIRGLSSNRVLVYTQGVRLENQQFGDEHGLGLSSSGVESVEVIKGPASLLYNRKSTCGCDNYHDGSLIRERSVLLVTSVI